MNAIILPENHFFLTVASKVKNIAKPLFQKTKITFFDYARFYKDRSAFFLSSKHEIVKFFLGKQYSIMPPISTELVNEKFKQLLPSKDEEGPYKPVMNEIYHHFNLAYGMNVIEKGDNYYDAFCFFTDGENHSGLNYLVNNFSIIEKFIRYFKVIAKPLIQKALSHRVLLPESMFPKFIDASLNVSKDLLSKTICFNCAIKNDCLKCQNISLSKREMQCLVYLSKGKTMKAMANKMNISPRTVEYYINNIKAKLGCHRKSDLVDFYYREIDIHQT